jgi:hypothetical protein
MVSKETIITGAMLILITYTLGLSLISQAFPATQISQTLSSSGSIQIETTADIGIYSNSYCTIPLSSLAWGTLQPGGIQEIDCWIRNEGSTPLTLSMHVSNWYPTSLATSNYLVLSWNYDSSIIDPDAAIPVTLTLTVSADISGVTNFSFDVSIVGTGQ